MLHRNLFGFCQKTIKHPSVFNRYIFSSSSMSSKNVALILSGCGVYDGSEVHEASSCLVHLSRAEAKVKMFAPDVNQMHVINHLNGNTMEQSRNVLEESARIARGAVLPLSQVNSQEFDAIIIPGGFGAAKNLSNFAVENASCTVNSDLSRVLKEFRSSNKPIGLCCIAPVIVAKEMKGVEVTMGQESGDSSKWPYAGATQAVSEMGSKHVPKEVNEIHVDVENNVVTTPAYMCNAPLHEIFDGIGKMVNEVLKHCK